MMGWFWLCGEWRHLAQFLHGKNKQALDGFLEEYAERNVFLMYSTAPQQAPSSFWVRVSDPVPSAIP